MKLHLDCLHSEYEVKAAREGFAKRDGEMFADAGYSNHSSLALVWDNAQALLQVGMYESAMIHAFTGCKLDNRKWATCAIEFMFSLGDRKKFVALGEPIPEKLTVYRGVYRNGRERQARGFSWTTSFDMACWFALRDLCTNPHPAIYRATVTARQVICHFHGRNEAEVITRPRKIELMAVSDNQMAIGAEIAQRKIRE